MKYPKINKKELDTINKSRFKNLYNTILEQILSDKEENEIKLVKGEAEMIAWNVATVLITRPY